MTSDNTSKPSATTCTRACSEQHTYEHGCSLRPLLGSSLRAHLPAVRAVIAAADRLAAPLRFQDPDNLSVAERALLLAFDRLAEEGPVPSAADPLPEEEIAAIEERAEKATDGPWTAEYSGETGNCVLPPGYESTREYVARTQLYLAVFDAKFIAAARTDVPRLVAALRAAYAERDQAKGIVAFARTEAERVQETRSKVLDLANSISRGQEGDDLQRIAHRIRLLLVRPIYMPGEEFDEESDRG